MSFTKSILVGFTLIALANSCATSTDSVLLGAGIGGIVGTGAGAVAGSNSNHPKEGAAVGLAVGSAIGGLMGYLKHKQNTEQKSKVQVGTNAEPPILSKPTIERIWVGPRIENNTYIEGHYQFVIKKPSHWSDRTNTQESSKTKDKGK